MSHTPECHLKASQGIPDRWHCPSHCPVAYPPSEADARDEMLETMWSGNEPTAEYFGPDDPFYREQYDRCAKENLDQLNAYRSAILRSVREKVLSAQPPRWMSVSGPMENGMPTNIRWVKIFTEEDVLALLDTEEGT